MFVCFPEQSECSPDICMNNGDCVIADASEGWSCMCKPGFAGERCERGIIPSFLICFSSC